ncbi:hypothetical protein BC829DRAFT_421203 [Chytridium lagenaria]|nr:hypothetical protein BC829DRAFT_421203 [Chytridium lagenaria]
MAASMIELTAQMRGDGKNIPLRNSLNKRGYELADLGRRNNLFIEDAIDSSTWFSVENQVVSNYFEYRSNTYAIITPTESRRTHSIICITEFVLTDEDELYVVFKRPRGERQERPIPHCFHQYFFTLEFKDEIFLAKASRLMKPVRFFEWGDDWRITIRSVLSYDVLKSKYFPWYYYGITMGRSR